MVDFELANIAWKIVHLHDIANEREYDLSLVETKRGKPSAFGEKIIQVGLSAEDIMYLKSHDVEVSSIVGGLFTINNIYNHCVDLIERYTAQHRTNYVSKEPVAA